MRAFLDHSLRGKNHATGEMGTPLDFVSFHAKGAPRQADGHVRMGIAEQLRTIDDGFRIVASYPELKETPIIIGECDPEGCAACQGPQLAYRNGTMYSSYTAASFARIHELADVHGVNLEGALTWAFEFEDQPLFAGFRSLATGGIDKPVLSVFRMMSRMSGERLKVDGDHLVSLNAMLQSGVRGKPDVSALASLDAEHRRLCILAWHYHDDDVPGDDAAVELSLANLPFDVGDAAIDHHRIDHAHSNAYSKWKKMGSPAKPTPEQYTELLAAGQLAKLPEDSLTRTAGTTAKLGFTLPRQAVSLLTIEWKSENSK
jgi:xylan 1,4-beta-xylosidase